MLYICPAFERVRGLTRSGIFRTKPQKRTERKDRLHHQDGPVTKKLNLFYNSEVSCFPSLCLNLAQLLCFFMQKLPEVQQLVRSLEVENKSLREVRKHSLY